MHQNRRVKLGGVRLLWTDCRTPQPYCSRGSQRTLSFGFRGVNGTDPSAACVNTKASGLSCKTHFPTSPAQLELKALRTVCRDSWSLGSSSTNRHVRRSA